MSDQEFKNWLRMFYSENEEDVVLAIRLTPKHHRKKDLIDAILFRVWWCNSAAKFSPAKDELCTLMHTRRRYDKRWYELLYDNLGQLKARDYYEKYKKLAYES